MSVRPFSRRLTTGLPAPRVVHVSPSGRATGLTIDQDSHTLYWTDQDSLTLKSTSLHR